MGNYLAILAVAVKAALEGNHKMQLVLAMRESLKLSRYQLVSGTFIKCVQSISVRLALLSINLNRCDFV